ncbi:MAG: hypothetical protein EPO46_00080 [Lysobacter sp.]|nr:MAG: hypothetical protein EPO46_00080 [Lysobacter sp.]
MKSLLCAACLCLLAACSEPKLPDKERPVEPQTTARHDDLKRAIDAPLERAKSVQDTLDAADRAQREQIDAAESGQPTGT